MRSTTAARLRCTIVALSCLVLPVLCRNNIQRGPQRGPALFVYPSRRQRQSQTCTRYTYRALAISLASPRGEGASSPPPQEHRRTLADQMDEADGQLRLTPIGVVRSVYNLCVGTPRQGLLAPQARGRIDLTGSLLANGEDAVQGLDEYSHIWIVFCFHLNTLPKDSHKIPSKIAPPALGGRKIGVLASRSPHRPNPVGMTLAKLDRITTTQRYLHDDGLDLVDGTPVLDIKPYVPVYDAVPDCVLPAWVTDGLQMERPVQWTATARENLWQILTDDPTALRFYGSDESSGGGGGSRRIGEQVDDTIADVTACIEQVLARDVRSRWQTKKTRKGAFQAERSHRIDTATVVEDSSSANVVDSLQPQVSSSMLKKECTQQLDRLLIHYNVKEKAQQRRPESQGSGAEDEVTITTVTLLPVASTVESQEVA